MNSTERYRYYRSLGLCPLCGKVKSSGGKILCKSCRAQTREERRLRREQAVSLGICPRCFKVKLYVREKICPDCLEEARRFRARHRDEINEKQRIYRKTHPPQDDGKCIYCHKRPPEAGHKSCAYCRASRRNKAAAKRGCRLTPSERPLYGLCYYCGEPVMDGKKVCKKHYDMSISHLKRASNQDHWWRKDEHMRYEHIKKGKKP